MLSVITGFLAKPKIIMGLLATLVVALVALWVTNILHDRAMLRLQVNDLEHQIEVQQHIIENKEAAISALEREASDARKAGEQADEIEDAIDNAPGGDPVPGVVVDTLDRLRDLSAN